MRLEAAKINKALHVLGEATMAASIRKSNGEKRPTTDNCKTTQQKGKKEGRKSRIERINKLRIAPGMQNYRELQDVIGEFEENSLFQFKRNSSSSSSHLGETNKLPTVSNDGCQSERMLRSMAVCKAMIQKNVQGSVHELIHAANVDREAVATGDA